MSTRYVWGKYEVSLSYSEKRSEVTYFDYVWAQSISSNPYPEGAIGTGYKQDGERLILTGNTIAIPTWNINISQNALEYPYARPDTYSYMQVICYNKNKSNVDWGTRLIDSPTNTCRIHLADDSKFELIQLVSSGDSGSYIENVASDSSSTYPKDGLSGYYWYVYQGSDSIDPTAVTYSKSELQVGESITIYAAAVTPTHGGTISYLYQYSTNGGSSWTNIGSATTSTSVSITIPAGATQFQARVLASDGWGFTSATYVYGPSLGVSSFKAYVGVGGKARAVQKIYVGVNGKAREVVKGYVGVGGKARRFL